MRIRQQLAYVLLNRAYSETSWMVELITRDYGRVVVLAKGARRPKSKWKGVLLPFQRLLVDFTGKGEVATLTQAEIDEPCSLVLSENFVKDSLICGLYCNELIVKMLHRHDPHPLLFDGYQQTISALRKTKKNTQRQHVLRFFEHYWMRHCGYGVDFEHEANTQLLIVPEVFYLYQHGDGFIRCLQKKKHSIAGKVLLFLAQYQVNYKLPNNLLDFDNCVSLTSVEVGESKRLMRYIVQQNLGYQKIYSRYLLEHIK